MVVKPVHGYVQFENEKVAKVAGELAWGKKINATPGTLHLHASLRPAASSVS